MSLIHISGINHLGYMMANDLFSTKYKVWSMYYTPFLFVTVPIKTEYLKGTTNLFIEHCSKNGLKKYKMFLVSLSVHGGGFKQRGFKQRL